MNSIGTFMLFLSKVTISLLSGVICYVLCKFASANKNQYITPTFFTICISYFVAFYVIEVLTLTVDTIFMAFSYENRFLLADREAGAKCFAPRRLASLIDMGHERIANGENHENPENPNEQPKLNKL